MWSERYDREMKDVFEVQDEIARKIAEALRVTLSPQELEALAVKPTENLQAYDLYLRGKRYARRQTRQDLEFALEMFENAVTIDPSFALAYAACANACAMFLLQFQSRSSMGRARARRFGQSGGACAGICPKCKSARPGYSMPLTFMMKRFAWCTKRLSVSTIAKAPTTCLPCAICRRPLSGNCRGDGTRDGGERRRLQRLCPDRERSRRARQNRERATISTVRMAALENHLKQVPEDARARILLGGDYAELGRVEDALRETGLAITLRANEASILYNAACTYVPLKKTRSPGCASQSVEKASAMRRGPAATPTCLLHDDPEFERLYPRSRVCRRMHRRRL